VKEFQSNKMKVRYLVLPMIFVGVLSAQPGRGFRGSLTPPTPEQMVERRVNFLTKFFSLTTSQVTDVTGILTAEQKCLAAVSPTPQAARAAFVTAVKGANPTVIASAMTAVTSSGAAAETCRLTAAAAIYADLTDPAQQAKVGNGLGPLLGGGGGPHFGPHPGGPPPAH
jgi:hypothetical protein